MAISNRNAVRTDVSNNYPKIGSLLRDRRNYHGWTLTDVSRMTGISVSALSKIENDAMSPTYATILQLCDGLKIEIGDLLNPAGSGAQQNIMGRRSISRQHEGNTLSDENYSYTYLCSEVAHKRIIPMAVTVSARQLSDVGEMWSHVGEIFLYVLTGKLRLITALYEPTDLAAGDSVYIDSTMRHAYFSTGEGDAEILVMCSSATPNLAQTLREILKERLAKGAGNPDDVHQPEAAALPKSKSAVKARGKHVKGQGQENDAAETGDRGRRNQRNRPSDR